MKITRSDGSVLEGSPEELARFEEAKKGSSSAKISPQNAINGSNQGDYTYVSTDVARRALSRIKLNPTQVKLLRKLYAQGDAWTPATVLQRELSYTPSQFAGLMGAFGRRVNYTPGWVAGSAFFDQEWDSKLDCYKYRLPPSVRQAVSGVGL